MHSGSKAFEKGYAAFLQYVFENKVYSLERIEDANARMIVLARTRRLVCHKKSGLLSSESLSIDGNWEQDKNFPLDHFWAGDSVLLSAIQSAWTRQLHRFIPPVEKCYPKLSQKEAKKWSPDYKWQAMVSYAAERRMGGRDKRRSVCRIFVSLLWNFLVDREMLRLCQAFFGRKATPADYNFTVKRCKELNARAKETPNLTPLIGSYIRLTPALRGARKVLPPDILACARSELFDVTSRRATGRYRDDGSNVFPPEPLSPAGWRILAGTSTAAVERLWTTAQHESHLTIERGYSPGPLLAGPLNAMARADVRAPLMFQQWVVRHLITWQLYGLTSEQLKQVRDSTIRFIRLAAQEAVVARRRGNLKRFLSGSLVLAWDWFKSQGREGHYYYDRDVPIVPIVISKQTTWAAVMRAQAAWHMAQDERERLRREADEVRHKAWREAQDAKSWESALSECLVGSVRATPLTTGQALRVEGEEMKHCVGGYVDYCVNGSSRIFALQHKDERATVELVHTGRGTWKVRQVFGPRNDNVSKPVAAAAKALASAYVAAFKEQQRPALSLPG
jgi:hypothetical protein